MISYLSCMIGSGAGRSKETSTYVEISAFFHFGSAEMNCAVIRTFFLSASTIAVQTYWYLMCPSISSGSHFAGRITALSSTSSSSCTSFSSSQTQHRRGDCGFSILIDIEDLASVQRSSLVGINSTSTTTCFSSSPSSPSIAPLW